MSPLPYEFALALRYLRPKRTFVSIITLICILGVALGVSVLIIVISVMTGFSRELRERLVGFNAHIRIERQAGVMTEWQPLMDRLATNPAVRGVAPYVNTQIVLETQPANGTEPRSFGTIARGIDPRWEAQVSDLPKSVYQGEFRLTPNSILVPSVLAREQGIQVGDRVAVYSVPALRRMRDAQKAGEEEVVTADDYLVRGLLDFGMNDLNAALVVTSLADAQELAGRGEGVQGITVMLHDPGDMATDAVSQALRRELGPEYFVSNWLLENRDFLNALATEKGVMFYILFFIVIVAAFGIMSALITFVVQKTREIGVLKALGATRLSIAGIFLGQSLVVGVLGVLSGLGGGMLALRYRNEFLRFMSETVGFNLFPPNVYQFQGLPALVVPGDVLVICGVSLVICVLAGVLPAVRAAWLEPVEALRHE